MTTVTVTKKNISATITSSATLRVGYYHDGNPYIVVGSSTASITSFNPATTTIIVGGVNKLINGAIKNPRGNPVNGSGSAWQGIDERGGLYPYTSTLTQSVPISCLANDVVVLSKCDPITPPNHNRNGYISGLSTTRSYTTEMMCITFLTSDPGTDSFRPSAFGPSSSTRKVGSLSQIKISEIPQLITPGSATGPSYEYLTQAFSDFCGEMMTGWNTDGITPDLQHPGYGQQMAGLVSQALCKLLEIPTPLDSKKREILALKLTQWGIDLWGAFKDGRINNANGGHQQGRKALVMFAGLMLSDPDMIDPDTYINNTPAGYGLSTIFATTGLGHFQEGHAYVKRLDQDESIWYGGRWAHMYNDSGLTVNSMTNLIKNHPSTGWPSLPLTSPGLYRTQFSYWGDETAGSQVGTALFMKAIRRTDEWSHAGLAYITQCMQCFNTTIAADFSAYNLDLNGTTVDGGGRRIFISNAPTNGQYCSNLWRIYAFTPEFCVNSIDSYYGVSQPNGSFLTCYDNLVWGTNVILEVYNAPTSGISSTELYFGDLQDPPTSSGGANIYVSNTSLFGGIVTISNPNSYGILLVPVALPSSPTGIQMQLICQIVFTMTDGSKRATNAIRATLQI